MKYRSFNHYYNIYSNRHGLHIKEKEVKNMDIGENISNSIRYPLTDWVKIIILAVISIIPIVNFMSYGYYLRIIKSTLAGIDEVPEFDDLGELFIDGLKVIVAGIVYMIVPIILFIIASLFAAPASYSYGSSFIPMAFSGLSLLFWLIGIILAIIVSVFFLPAIVNMALYDSDIGAAFRFSEIMDLISAIGWADYIIWIIVIWIVAFILALVIGLVGAILLFILIGFLVLFLGAAYINMFVFRSLALLFAESIYTSYKINQYFIFLFFFKLYL